MTLMLMEARTNLAVVGLDGMTQLHLAAQNGRERVVQLPLKAGADVTAENCSGKTTLHPAVVSSNQAVVWVLLRAGADMRLEDFFRRTPLHNAIELEGIASMVPFSATKCIAVTPSNALAWLSAPSLRRR
jgi:ankyrin repeat protein